MKKFIAAAALLASIIPSVFAQNLVGKWNGSIQAPKIDESKILDPSKIKDEKKKQEATMMRMMAQQMKMLASVRMNLTMNSNNTFTIVTPPMQAGGQTMPASTSTGTWSVKGNQVTFTTKKSNNTEVKAGTQGSVQTMTLSADGKTMTLVPPMPANAPAQARQVRVVFRKA